MVRHGATNFSQSQATYDIQIAITTASRVHLATSNHSAVTFYSIRLQRQTSILDSS